MAYNKQTWINYPNTTTPLNATRLNYMENGIFNAETAATAASLVGAEFIQATPASVWPIPNPLGRYPRSVTVIVGGEEVTAEVDFPDINTISITFSSPQAGRVEII